MRTTPALVAQLTHVHNAWIVGSAAKEGADLKIVRDWDVLVPFSNWQAAAALLPKDAAPNTFGGWKCVSEGVVVDVWPDDLGRIMTRLPTCWRSGRKTRALFARNCAWRVGSCRRAFGW